MLSADGQGSSVFPLSRRARSEALYRHVRSHTDRKIHSKPVFTLRTTRVLFLVAKSPCKLIRGSPGQLLRTYQSVYTHTYTDRYTHTYVHIASTYRVVFLGLQSLDVGGQLVKVWRWCRRVKRVLLAVCLGRDWGSVAVAPQEAGVLALSLYLVEALS